MTTEYLTKKQLEWLSCFTVNYRIEGSNIVIVIPFVNKKTANEALHQLESRER